MATDLFQASLMHLLDNVDYLSFGTQLSPDGVSVCKNGTLVVYSSTSIRKGLIAAFEHLFNFRTVVPDTFGKGYGAFLHALEAEADKKLLAFWPSIRVFAYGTPVSGYTVNQISNLVNSQGRPAGLLETRLTSPESWFDPILDIDDRFMRSESCLKGQVNSAIGKVERHYKANRETLAIPLPKL